MGNEVRVQLDLQRSMQGVCEGELRTFLYDSWNPTAKPVKFSINQIALNDISLFSREQYGEALWKALFANPIVEAELTSARRVADERDLPLHFQLYIRDNAWEMNKLAWELLRDPDNQKYLCPDANTLFSRYLEFDYRKSRPLTPQSSLRALVAAANPRSSRRFRLSRVEVEAELAAAREALKGIEQVDFLPGKAGEFCTLNNLIQRLERGRYDILYLICHGRVDRDNTQTKVFLEDGFGGCDDVSDDDLTDRIWNVSRAARPRLIVLSACHSAASTQGIKHQTLGRKLIGAGVPAVVAMQNEISVDTARRVITAFFEELMQDPRIDRALALARQKVLHRKDWWMPVLYMNGPNGLLWVPELKKEPLPSRAARVWIKTPVHFQRKQRPENYQPAPLKLKVYVHDHRRKNGKAKKWRVVRPAPQVPVVGMVPGLEGAFDQVERAVKRGARVIILHGEPGSGRSTLAALLADQYSAQYPDGSLYYPYPVDDPLLKPQVADMLAHVLHSYLPYFPVPDTQAELLTSLGRVLATQRALVLLEDADAEELVLPLARLLPQGLILVTACGPLHLDGISTYTIQLGELAADAAAQLLRKSVPEASDAKVVDYLRRHVCSGLPLSLQLFARLRENRLNQALKDIVEPILNIQRTNRLGQLPSVLAYSLNMLPADQAAALHQLSVFSDAFDVYAAAAVLGRAGPDLLLTREDGPAQPVKALLEQLVRLGLLAYEMRGKRYQMHPVVRAEAYRRLLAGQGLAVEAHARHAEAYLHLLSSASAEHLRSPNDGLAAFQRFDQGWREIQRGQRFLARAGEDEQKRADLCARYWEEGRSILANRLTSRQREQWLRDGLSTAGSISNSLSMVYSDLGTLYADQGDFRAAEDYYARSIRVKQDMRDKPGEADELRNLAEIYQRQNKIRDEIRCHDRCIEVWEALQDDAQLAQALFRRGVAYWSVDQNRALPDFERCEDLARRLPDDQLRCEVSLRLGRYYFDRRDKPVAERWYGQALRLSLLVNKQKVEREARARLEDLKNM